MDFWLILFIFDGILFIIIAGTVLYMGIFAVAALFHSKPDIPKAKRMNRFVILIPAYKQDNVIEQTVLSVLSQAYPQRMFDVTVISDHQEEITNMRLAQYPITLLTPDFEESTKAKSLQYAILNLPEFKIYDAVIILDGDNIIDQDFLDQVNDAYEIAAIPGTIICGWLSDKVFHGRRALPTILFMGLLIVAIWVYMQNLDNLSVVIGSLIAIGFLIYGPVMLIGVQALDLAPKNAAGTAAGLTGFMGYVLGTAVLANIVIGYVAETAGWEWTFYLLIAACVMSILFMGLTYKEEQYLVKNKK